MKVWFQNRRTKEKRIQQEDEGESTTRTGADGEGAQGVSKINEEDELEEDLEDDEEDDEEVASEVRKREIESIQVSRQSCLQDTVKDRLETTVEGFSEAGSVKRKKFDNGKDVITNISSSASLFLTPPNTSSLSSIDAASSTHTTAASTASSLSRISLENVFLPTAILGPTGVNNFDTIFESKNGHPSNLRTSNLDAELIK